VRLSYSSSLFFSITSGGYTALAFGVITDELKDLVFDCTLVKREQSFSFNTIPVC
jgi:hypothetical protein